MVPFSFSVGERKIMNHFVVSNLLLSSVPGMAQAESKTFKV